MNIRRKVFSSISENDIISEIEERAFAEGYDAARADFADYDAEQKARKRRRIGGHVMGALGTAGLMTHGIIAPLAIHEGNKAMNQVQTEEARALAKRGLRRLSVGNACLGLSAAALTAGGLYRINRAKNKKQTFEEWTAEKKEKNNNE